MPLSELQTLGMILAVALGTMLTRFLPFEVFRGEPPLWVRQLGRLLPPAMMGFLVVYCLKGIQLTISPYALPELLAIAAVVGLHLWKHNVLLSIGGGTALYMVLIRLL